MRHLINRCVRYFSGTMAVALIGFAWALPLTSERLILLVVTAVITGMFCLGTYIEDRT